MIFLRNRLADFELYVAQLLHEARRLRGRAQPREILHRELRWRAGRPAVARNIIEAYRNLGMIDLAANAERVYVDNYPASSLERAPKKSWWRRIL